jgi:hypothetical protein
LEEGVEKEMGGRYEERGEERTMALLLLLIRPD